MPSRKTQTKAPVSNQQPKAPRFQIIKLEERITPGLRTNHNQTFLRG